MRCLEGPVLIHHEEGVGLRHMVGRALTGRTGSIRSEKGAVILAKQRTPRGKSIPENMSAASPCSHVVCVPILKSRDALNAELTPKFQTVSAPHWIHHANLKNKHVVAMPAVRRKLTWKLAPASALGQVQRPRCGEGSASLRGRPRIRELSQGLSSLRPAPKAARS